MPVQPCWVCLWQRPLLQKFTYSFYYAHIHAKHVFNCPLRPIYPKVSSSWTAEAHHQAIKRLVPSLKNTTRHPMARKMTDRPQRHINMTRILTLASCLRQHQRQHQPSRLSRLSRRLLRHLRWANTIRSTFSAMCPAVLMRLRPKHSRHFRPPLGTQ